MQNEPISSLDEPPQFAPSPGWLHLRRELRSRYLRVLFFFAGVLLSVLWWDIILRRVGLGRLSKRTASRRYRRIAQRFRSLATRMGGVWIKVGQFLSSRLDVLPVAITDELSNLQDEVSPETYETMLSVMENELEGSISTFFASIDEQPLASASLGQVHRARLPNGDAVVVKIQRPNIHDVIQTDLEALGWVVRWLKRYRPIARRADLNALLEEFSRTLWEEVDYLAEAENARRFAMMFAEDPQIHIPVTYPDLTTGHVLTLEDVYFIKITDFDAIETAGVDRAQVADRLFHNYLHQIFLEGFFHADPHPGNLFVEPLGQGDWRLVFVDFGMVGHLTPVMKSGLRDLAIAVGTRDLDRLMQAFQTMGVILPGADLGRIRQAEAALFDQLWGKSMRDLTRTHPQEMRKFASEFRDVLYEMPFQVPSDMIYLGRCVAILAGMCTGLDPDFNLFKELRPFTEQLLAEDGADWLGELLKMLGEPIQVLATLPKRLDATLTVIERGDLIVTTKASPELQKQLSHLTSAVNRLMGVGVFAAFLVVGSILYINEQFTPGIIFFSLAFVSLTWALLKPMK